MDEKKSNYYNDNSINNVNSKNQSFIDLNETSNSNQLFVVADNTPKTFNFQDSKKPINADDSISSDTDLYKELTKRNKENKDEYYKGSLDTLINDMKISYYSICVFFVFSLLIMVDGGEMTVISLLVTKLGTSWQLSKFEKGLMGSAVFVGFFMGTLISGKVSDVSGRKPIFLIGNFMVSVFAISSAFSPNFALFAVFRGFCGFGIGLSLPAAAALSAEICPSKYRGILLNLLALFFPLGEILTALLAKYLLNNSENGWRYLLAVISLPMILAFLLSIVVRESPRFLANNKEFQKTFVELEFLLDRKLTNSEKSNVKKEVNLASENLSVESSYFSLFTKQYIFLNLSVSFLLFSCSFIYYGVIYVLPEGLQNNFEQKKDKNNQNSLSNFDSINYNNASDNITLRMLDYISDSDNTYSITNSSDSTLDKYIKSVTSTISSNESLNVDNTFITDLDMKPNNSTNNNTNYEVSTNNSNLTSELNEVFDGVIYSALSEIPSPIVAMILVNIKLFGRRYSIAIGFILVAFFAVLSAYFNEHLIVLASLLKFSINIPFAISYLYVSEAFPTKIRSIAIGFTNSFTRLGGIITPIASQFMYEINRSYPYIAYFLNAILATIIAFFLPIETYGRALD